MQESRQYLENPDELINGWKFIEKYVRIKGTKYRLNDIVPFSNKDEVWLEFEREPDNKYDNNAIKVIGCSKRFFTTRKYFLGYVPKEISAELYRSGLIRYAEPRIRRIWISDEEDDATVIFQILIPEDVEERYNCRYVSSYDSHH